ncbi:very short patch repair endonuclease [Xanthomonas perforans]|uniref:Very short patch repair endonuclease n=1 Tax=Xanthomonas euvesicatoria TaxID=456327 RepID=A0AAX4FGB5_XANEU|nr:MULTISPECIES: very short patch repair endonuclease [Xanthomonas]MBV6787613.1 very short patch repair endonuclease [Xanthomonas campestris pv. uppalii]OOX20729.1 very short patch repair endonuclease [Xanthomonas axonopodis pv. bauhiniae]PWH21101.1 very short patch repair endonuclease [Xanthomonas perforans]WOP47172.1 very short patch repair endonuclease [Xanthomonas euvesicatoria]WOP53413.1 very short patch repair endonuclease [Xanthomonas euvesicatoria]
MTPVAEKISPETRSRMMSGIKGKNTRPEIAVRSFLHRNGFRFRLHGSRLPGRPDVVLPRWNAVVFVHGCFWHGHSGCHYFKLPKTRTDFWQTKIDSNSQRDALAIHRLRQAGWRVAVIWECALRDESDRALDELLRFIRSEDISVEVTSLKR